MQNVALGARVQFHLDVPVHLFLGMFPFHALHLDLTSFHQSTLHGGSVSVLIIPHLLRKLVELELAPQSVYNGAFVRFAASTWEFNSGFT